MLQTLMNLNKSIQENYIEGKPRLLGDAKSSIFKLLTEFEYTACSTQEIQGILRTQHIIIKNRNFTNCSFDEKGLRTLRPLNEPIAIVGKSLRPQNTYSLSPWTDHSVDVNESKEGTLRQILDSGKQTDGKILSALPLPIVYAGYEANPFSSDHAAWMQTLSSPFSKDTVPVPVGDLRWGMCATAGAFNNYRINRNGFGTIIDPIHGSIVWISASTASNASDRSISGVEAIHLEPGTRL